MEDNSVWLQYTMPHTHDMLFESMPSLIMTYTIAGYIPPNAGK